MLSSPPILCQSIGFHSRLREHSTTNHVYQDTSIYKLEQKIAALITNIIEALAKPRSWEGQRPRCPRFAATRATRTLPLPGSPTSFHPIQTLLTPIATPIFTHEQRLRVSIPEHVPQYSKLHPTVSAFAPDTFPDAIADRILIDGFIYPCTHILHHIPISFLFPIQCKIMMLVPVQ